MYRSEKYLLNPNKEQKAELNNQLGAQRFVYNQLVQYNEFYDLPLDKRSKDGRYLFIKTLKYFHPWLNEIGAQYIAYTISYYETALTRAMRGIGKFPKKHKPGNDAVTASQGISVDDTYIKMPIIGKIKYKSHKNKYFGNKIQKITIKKILGKYYAIICYILLDVPKIQINKIMGIDCGINNIAVTSDGDEYEVYNDTRIEIGIKSLQRQLSKKQEAHKVKKRDKRSRKYIKTLNKLQTKCRKQANRRRNHLHKVSKEIVSSADAIIVEDLAIAEMMKNPHMARKIANAAMGIFINQLEYKCEDMGKTFIKIDRYYPSSKTCSSCSHIKPSLPLPIRTYECKKCGYVGDRDVNAAINIRREGCSRIPGGLLPVNHALITPVIQIMDSTSSNDAYIDIDDIDINTCVITEGNPVDVGNSDITNI